MIFCDDRTLTSSSACLESLAAASDPVTSAAAVSFSRLRIDTGVCASASMDTISACLPSLTMPIMFLTSSSWASHDFSLPPMIPSSSLAVTSSVLRLSVNTLNIGDPTGTMHGDDSILARNALDTGLSDVDTTRMHCTPHMESGSGKLWNDTTGSCSPETRAFVAYSSAADFGSSTATMHLADDTRPSPNAPAFGFVTTTVCRKPGLLLSSTSIFVTHPSFVYG